MAPKKKGAPARLSRQPTVEEISAAARQSNERMAELSRRLQRAEARGEADGGGAGGSGKASRGSLPAAGAGLSRVASFDSQLMDVVKDMDGLVKMFARGPSRFRPGEVDPDVVRAEEARDAVDDGDAETLAALQAAAGGMSLAEAREAAAAARLKALHVAKDERLAAEMRREMTAVDSATGLVHRRSLADARLEDVERKVDVYRWDPVKAKELRDRVQGKRRQRTDDLVARHGRNVIEENKRAAATRRDAVSEIQSRAKVREERTRKAIEERDRRDEAHRRRTAEAAHLPYVAPAEAPQARTGGGEAQAAKTRKVRDIVRENKEVSRLSSPDQVLMRKQKQQAAKRRREAQVQLRRLEFELVPGSDHRPKTAVDYPLFIPTPDRARHAPLTRGRSASVSSPRLDDGSALMTDPRLDASLAASGSLAPSLQADVSSLSVSTLSASSKLTLGGYSSIAIPAIRPVDAERRAGKERPVVGSSADGVPMAVLLASVALSDERQRDAEEATVALEDALVVRGNVYASRRRPASGIGTRAQSASARVRPLSAHAASAGLDETFETDDFDDVLSDDEDGE